MIKQVKQFTVNMIAGANVATVVLMLASGYADRLSPVNYPILSLSGMVFPVFLLINLLFVLLWIIIRWQRLWIPIVGYLMAYPPISTYMPLNPQQEVPEGSIKVISYNICSYGGNYKYEDAFDRILNYFDTQQADIVCLQEDVDTWRRFMLQRYKKLYPYNDTTVFINSPQLYNGLGIHSRYPILRKERINYESKANGSVAYFLKVGDDTILVINNHLEGTHLTAEDRRRYKDMLKGDVETDTVRTESKLLISKLGRSAAKRAPQAEAVNRYIAAHRCYPVIVCGDFNDTPISYAHRTVSKDLTDCFTASGFGVGVSYNQKGFWVRIDNILCSSHFTPYNCKIDTKTDYSDHYPMICWLKKQDK